MSAITLESAFCGACGCATATLWGLWEDCADCYRVRMASRNPYGCDPYAPDTDW